MISCASESLGRFLEDLRRHTITAAAANMISSTRAVPAPMAMPTNSAVLSWFPRVGLPFAAPFVIGVLLTAAPVEPVDAVGEPPAPPARFVDPADEDGNTKEVENVDSKDGTATDGELTGLIGIVELVGSGTTGGVDWLTVVDIAGGLAELDAGGTTVKVVKVVGGGSTTVEVDVSAGGGGAVVGGSGAAVDAVTLSAKTRDTYMSLMFNSLAAGAGALTVRPGTWTARVSSLSRDEDDREARSALSVSRDGTGRLSTKDSERESV